MDDRPSDGADERDRRTRRACGLVGASTQIPTLPAFVLDERCPIAVVREFLAGVFGADGHAPVLHRYGPGRRRCVARASGVLAERAAPSHVHALEER